MWELEEHQEEYYQALRNISKQDDWNYWLAFYLRAVEQQATSNAARVRKMQALYDDMKRKIRDITHSQYSIQVLDALFDRPIFRTSDFVQRTGIQEQTAMPIILVVVGSDTRRRFYQ